MKTSILRLAVCAIGILFFGYNGWAQSRLTDAKSGGLANRRDWVLAETGADHRKWQSRDAAGQLHSIVEMGSGMNYWDGNRWAASEATFEAVDEGFVVSKAQHQIQLAANLNVQNAVIVNMADQSGLVIPSTPVAIGLYDAASGQSLIIAQIQDCAGAMIASNQVVYESALAGRGVSADVVYTVEKGSFEQDVVITTPLNPADYGFPAATTRVQVFTEFYSQSKPDKIKRPLRIEADASIRGKMVSPDLVDETLAFGRFVLAPGRASSRDKISNQETGAPVAKQFLDISGRNLLIESVEYPSVKKDFESQPLPSQPKTGAALPPSKTKKTELARLSIPKPGQSTRAAAKAKPSRMAKAATVRRSGVVIDFLATIGGPQTSKIFSAGGTYFVSSPVFCNGTTVIEGSAVIKFPNDTTTYIAINGPLTCNTTADSPAFFTAADDNSLGEAITAEMWPGMHNGTINPNGYALPALWMNSFGQTLSNLRFRYCREAVRVGISTTVASTLADSQIANCIKGVSIAGNGGSGSGSSGGSSGSSFGTYAVNVQNGLFTQVQAPIYGNVPAYYYNVNVYNSTFDNDSVLINNGNYATCNGNFLNCIFGNIGYPGSGIGSAYFSGSNNGFYNCSQFGSYRYSVGSNPFRVAGMGAYYLLLGSPFRNVGTTSIGSSLWAHLQTLTTYAPQDGSALDTAPPDLGYHYSVNEDSDHDGLPDSWEWKYFGNFDQTGSGDYDGDGVSNLAEFQNGTDPNDIRFSIKTANNYVTGSAALQLNVQAGTAFYEAVLVDSEDFAHATWNPYTSPNVTVPLTGEGWHEVWIGLRGRPDEAAQSWKWKRLKLDSTPPQLTITSPANGTVSQPLLQIQGFSPEPLRRISCDINNGNGLAANRKVLVMNQHYDTTSFEFTTSFFQLFDVDLAVGLNTFTFHATDLAGNETVTDFTVTLASDNIAPVVNVGWPQNGMQVCGSQFTINGSMDDPSAMITATLTAATGETSTYPGLVERDGKFWIEHLPLNDGTTQIILRAVDVWNNITTLNFSVTKSLLTLTVDPIPTVDLPQLHAQKVALHGSISDPTCSVYVNGFPAEIQAGQGTWSIAGIPVNAGGTASFNVEARASNGAIAGNASENIDKPERVYIKTYFHKMKSEDYEKIEEASSAGKYIKEDKVNSETFRNWTDKEGGEGSSFWEETFKSDKYGALSGTHSRRLSNWQWPLLAYEELPLLSSPRGWSEGFGCSGGVSPTTFEYLADSWTGSGEPSGTPTRWVEDANNFLGVGCEHCSVNDPLDFHYASCNEAATICYTDDIHNKYERNAQTEVEVFTGGKALPRRSNLWVASATASQRRPRQEPYCPDGGTDNPWSHGVPIDPNLVLIPNFGPVGEDDIAYAVLPDGATENITAYADGYDFYVFSEGASKLPNVDLDVDSDNNNGLDRPDRSPYEDEIEEQSPGKYLGINNGDADGDGIPDFADGYDKFGTLNVDGQSAAFVPLAFTPVGDITRAKVRFSFSESDPTKVVQNTDASGTSYTPAPGGLRLWAKNGNEFRKMAEINNYKKDAKGNLVHDGDRIKDGAEYYATNLTSLFVEGIQGGTYSIKMELDPDGESGYLVSDTVTVTVLGLDLDIDSDNNNGFNAPDRSAAEDKIEDDSTKPGKILWVHSGDSDDDGIPDYADGFNWDSTNPDDDVINAGDHFVPLIFELSPLPTLPDGKIRITYSGSDPSLVTYDDVSGQWQLPGGNLRIWRKDANVARNKNSANGLDADGNPVPPGDYVAPGTYTLSQLGVSSVSQTITLYVEGVTSGAEEISVEYDPDGDGPTPPPAQDKVRVTVENPNIEANIEPHDPRDTTDAYTEVTYSVSADEAQTYIQASFFIQVDKDADGNPIMEPVGNNSIVKWELLDGSAVGSLSSQETYTDDGFTWVKLTTSRTPGNLYKVRARLKKAFWNDNYLYPSNTIESAVIEVVPGRPKSMDLTASGNSMPADGKSERLITATIFDARGERVAQGTEVFWHLKGLGSVADTQESADENGQVTARLIAGNVAGNQEVQVEADGFTQTVTVQNTAVNITLGSSPGVLDMAAGGTAVITATLPGVADGAEVGWFSTKGTLSSSASLVYGGQATIFLQTSGETRTGDAVVTASLGGNVKTIRVPFTSSAPISLAASQPVIAGDATSDGSVGVPKLDGSTEQVPYHASSGVTIHAPDYPGEQASVVFGEVLAAQTIHFGFDALTGGVTWDDDLAFNATLSGATWSSDNPYSGAGSLRYNGASDSATIANSQAFHLQRDFAVGVWVYPSSIGGTLVTKSGEYSLLINGQGKPVFSIVTATGTHTVTGNFALSLNQWSWVEGRVTPDSTFSVSVNSQSTAGSYTGQPQPSSSSIVIGSTYSGYLDSFTVSRGEVFCATVNPPWTITGLDANGKVTLNGQGDATVTITGSGTMNAATPHGHRVAAQVSITPSGNPAATVSETIPETVQVVPKSEYAIITAMAGSLKVTTGSTTQPFTEFERSELVARHMADFLASAQKSRAVTSLHAGTLPDNAELGFRVSIWLEQTTDQAGHVNQIMRSTIDGVPTDVANQLNNQLAELMKRAAALGHDGSFQEFFQQNSGALISGLYKLSQENAAYFDDLALAFDGAQTWDNGSTVGKNYGEDLIQELGEMTGQEQLPSGFAQRTLSWLNKHLPSSPVTAWRKKVFNNVEDALRQHLNEAAAAGTIDPQVAYCAGYLWGIAKLINDSPNMAEDPMAGIKMGSELLSTVVRACAGDEEAKQSLLEMLPVYGTYRSFAGSFNDWEGGNYFDSGTKVFQGTLGAIGDVTLVSSIGLKSTRLLTKLNKVPTVVEAKLTPIVRPSAQLIDHFAMDAAKEYLEARGIRNVVALVNESNQGIDYIGWKTLRNGKNVPIFFEVKGHWQSGPPRLRFDQRAMDSFVRSRLETMLDPANARWANVDSEVIEAARKARDYIRSGGKIHGCVVNVDYALNNELRDIQVRYWRRTHPSVPVPWDVGD